MDLKDLKDRRLYRLQSRNLAAGVYGAAEQAFIGLRHKFGWRLDAEHLRGTGAFGTALPVEDTGIDLPPEVELRQTIDTIDEATGRPVDFNVALAHTGWGWHFVGETEPDRSIKPVTRQNRALFEWLEAQHQALAVGYRIAWQLNIELPRELVLRLLGCQPDRLDQLLQDPLEIDSITRRLADASQEGPLQDYLLRRFDLGHIEVLPPEKKQSS